MHSCAKLTIATEGCLVGRSSGRVVESTLTVTAWGLETEVEGKQLANLQLTTADVVFVSAFKSQEEVAR